MDYLDSKDLFAMARKGREMRELFSWQLIEVSLIFQEHSSLSSSLVFGPGSPLILKEKR